MFTARRLAVALVAVAFLISGALALQGCGADRPASTSAANSEEASGWAGTLEGEAAQPTDTEQPVSLGATASSMAALGTPDVPLHTSTVKLKGDERAVITTDRGVIEFKLYAKDAPNTAATFVELADMGFYDGIAFWRVDPGFVIQGGDPFTTDPTVGRDYFGTGGPGWRLKAEFNSRKHVVGTVAMARSDDPDSAGSQFYITLSPQKRLDNKYTIFGQVTKGLEVLPNIQVDDIMRSVRIEHGDR